ncbi:winged helix-turn-helix domain-containing protein [Paraburkholderia tropica]|uniref:winged helix-turn-helix domain-containing protein n=1 Tax=Paraburkholderia tropica TaxID=92647 RepID=UPI001F24E07C|nr:winged helix-turn-helix domain-containing protein [Paraburkholderia tropica]
MSLPRLTGQVLAFSRFWLARDAGLLIADGAAIDLAARPFAVLVALLDADGRVVSAAELRELVWNGAPVDANTVQAQISAIRRALDEERDLIVTVPGRGYRFSGTIRLLEARAAASGGESSSASASAFTRSDDAAQGNAPTASTGAASESRDDAGRANPDSHAPAPVPGHEFDRAFARAVEADFGAPGERIVDQTAPRAAAPRAKRLSATRPAAPAVAATSAHAGSQPGVAQTALPGHHEVDLPAPLSGADTASGSTSMPASTSAFAAFGPAGVEAALRAQCGAPLTPFTGRHAELSELLAVVPERRVVTLTGASGIGKTRLAAEAASRLGSHFPDGVFWADLASLSQPERIAHATGAALGLAPVPDYGSPAALAARIGARRVLIVIDHCDGLGEAAELTIEALVAGASGLHVLVTAQTPLFISGELPVAIAPLRTPPHGTGVRETGAGAPLASHDALPLLLAKLEQRLGQLAAYSPVQSRTQRPTPAMHDPQTHLSALHAAAQVTQTASPNDSVYLALMAATRVCQRVDGLPLALELAASAIAARTHACACTPAVNTDPDPDASASADAAPPLYATLAACAHELDALVTRRAGASRIALPHAEIVRVVLEWSSAALDETASVALRRLAIFAGAFSRAAALELLGAFALPDNDKLNLDENAESKPATLEHALRTLAHLGFINEADETPAANSVVATDCARLRLPPAVRRFALEALDRHRESHEASAHHANHLARMLARRVAQPVRERGNACGNPGVNTQMLRHDIDNLRAALDWALAANKVELCAELLDQGAPLWPALALTDEYVGWIRAALARAQAAPVRLIRDEMRLHAALARALPPTHASAAEIDANWSRAYALATECADTPYRLYTLFRLVMNAIDAGDVTRAAPLVTEFGEIAAIARHPAALVNAHCLEGLVHAWHGEFESAIEKLAPLVDHYTPGRLACADATPGQAIAALSKPASGALTLAGIDHETLLDAEAMARGFGLALPLVASAVLAVARWFVGVPLSGALDVSDDDPDLAARGAAFAIACALAVLDGDTARAQSCSAALIACARAGGPRRWLRAGLDVQLCRRARGRPRRRAQAARRRRAAAGPRPRLSDRYRVRRVAVAASTARRRCSAGYGARRRRAHGAAARRTRRRTLARGGDATDRGGAAPRGRRVHAKRARAARRGARAGAALPCAAGRAAHHGRHRNARRAARERTGSDSLTALRVVLRGVTVGA